MIYCDTSLLISGLTAETQTKTAQAWLKSQSAGSLCVSGWVIAEFSSALSIKLRNRELSEPQRAQVMTQWRLMLVENFAVLPIAPPAFDLAARIADQHELGVKAGDALHLAVASQAGLTLATLDRKMASAATTLGTSVAEIGNCGKQVQ
jgi:uncharacterized protein